MLFVLNVIFSLMFICHLMVICYLIFDYLFFVILVGSHRAYFLLLLFFQIYVYVYTDILSLVMIKLVKNFMIHCKKISKINEG
jgi:hypothetical protein